MSDYNGLRYFFDQPNINSRKARWLKMLCEFDMEIRYIKGKENMVINSLSRRVKVNHIASMSSYGRIL